MSEARPKSRPLLLEEMHHPMVADQLRQRGHDVIAVVETPELLAASDEDLFRWASERGRWIVTENIKDFRRLIARAEQADDAVAGVVFTSPHTFPRSRRNLGPLVEALHCWLTDDQSAVVGNEAWLVR